MKLRKVWKEIRDNDKVRITFPSGEKVVGNWYQDHLLDVYLRFKYSDCDVRFLVNDVDVDIIIKNEL